MTYQHSANMDLRLPDPPEPHEHCEHVEPLISALRSLIDMVTDNRLHGPEIDEAVDAIARTEGAPS